MSASLVLIQKSRLFCHRVAMSTLQVFSFVIQDKLITTAAIIVMQRIAIVLCVDMTTLRIIAVFLDVHKIIRIPASLAIQVECIICFQDNALDSYE